MMLRRGLALFERLARPLLLAEARCPGCGVVAAGQGAALCAECLAEFGPDAGPACPDCGRPGESTGDCPDCRAEPRPWGRLTAFGAYDGRLRELLLAYKFEARLELGRQLQECLDAAYGRALAEHPEFAACEMIVPVPLHPARLSWRGFNQSRELARLVSARRGLPIRQEALARVRRTTPQMELSRAERAANILGAFAARPEAVSGRTALLVDDIMTTGATLAECSRMLLGAGAAAVHVLVLARA